MDPMRALASLEFVSARGLETSEYGPKILADQVRKGSRKLFCWNFHPVFLEGPDLMGLRDLIFFWGHYFSGVRIVSRDNIYSLSLVDKLLILMPLLLFLMVSCK